MLSNTEIKERNLAIAKFIGWKLTSEGKLDAFKTAINNKDNAKPALFILFNDLIEDRELAFHKDTDWLYSLYQYILHKGYALHSVCNYPQKYKIKKISCISKNTIEVISNGPSTIKLYEILTDFIKKYNENSSFF